MKGRKRHLLVDTEGFVLEAKVMDHEGIKKLLQRADEKFPRLKHLWLDAGYRGEDEGKGWVEEALGWSVELVERPRKPAPEKVLEVWAAEWAKEGEKVDWRSSYRREDSRSSHGAGWWSALLLGSATTGG